MHTREIHVTHAGTRKETLHGFFFFVAALSNPPPLSLSLLCDSRIVGLGRSFVPAGLDEVLVAAARGTHTPRSRSTPQTQARAMAREGRGRMPRVAKKAGE